MSVPNNGGPAFPQSIIETRAGAFQASYDAPDGGGMSLRDYFATKILPAVYPARVDSGLDATQESIAAECYELADAMLDERDRQPANTSAAADAEKDRPF